MKLSLLSRSLLILATTQAHSFDCNEATTTREKAICNDETFDLVSYDKSLNELYHMCTKIGTAPPTHLKNEQISWLSRNETCGSDTKCIMEGYLTRISELAVCSFPDNHSSPEREAFELNFYDAVNSDMFPPLATASMVTPDYYVITVPTWQGGGGTSYEAFEFMRGDGARTLELERPILPSSDLELRRNPNISSDDIEGFTVQNTFWNVKLDGNILTHAQMIGPAGSVWEEARWKLSAKSGAELIYFAVEINAAEDGGKNGTYILIEK